jgi:hypothetical protein
LLAEVTDLFFQIGVISRQIVDLFIGLINLVGLLYNFLLTDIVGFHEAQPFEAQNFG